MDRFFKESFYDTPIDKKRKFIDKLFLNSRWYFVNGFVNIIIKSRSLAIKGKYDNSEFYKSSYEIVKLIEDCGGKIHIKGMDNLKSCDGPIVFISNHMSTLETFVFPSIIGPIMDVTYVVKESLIKHKLFGPVMRSRNPIIVKRENPREDLEQVLKKGKEALESGVSVIIFPQSTRTTNFVPKNFNSIGIKLAKLAGAKVIPIAIKTDFWGNGKIMKDVGPVNRNEPINITFGKPFLIEGNGKEEHKQIIEFVKQNVIEWGVGVEE